MREPLEPAALYQVTASAVPMEGNKMTALAAVADNQGLKPHFPCTCGVQPRTWDTSGRKKGGLQTAILPF